MKSVDDRASISGLNVGLASLLRALERGELRKMKFQEIVGWLNDPTISWLLNAAQMDKDKLEAHCVIASTEADKSLLSLMSSGNEHPPATTVSSSPRGLSFAQVVGTIPIQGRKQIPIIGILGSVQTLCPSNGVQAIAEKEIAGAFNADSQTAVEPSKNNISGRDMSASNTFNDILDNALIKSKKQDIRKTNKMVVPPPKHGKRNNRP